jgi:hypothetical protein
VDAADGADTTEPFDVAVIAVDPHAGGAYLMPGALSVRIISGEILRPLDDMIVLEGPRVSRGGTNATAGNAIRVNVQVRQPQQVSESHLTFELELAN